MKNLLNPVAAAIAIAVMVTVCSSATLQRDHLTPQEIELVKDAQMLDKRIEVFSKAIDRRLLVIGGGTLPNTKQSKKEAELWGDLPTGSRAELLGDIARIFDEAITNIDDVSSRDEHNPLISKALRRLAQEVNTVMTQVGPMRQTKNEAEIANLEMINDDAQQILAAVNKLPPEVEKKGKTKNAKDNN